MAWTAATVGRIKIYYDFLFDQDSFQTIPRIRIGPRKVVMSEGLSREAWEGVLDIK